MSAENVHKYYGEKIVNMLNNDVCKSDEDYFMLVENDYKLFVRDY